MILKLSVDDFKAHARTVSSPDELSMYIAKRLMQQQSPSLLWITMHDIDVAHSGAYSLYIDAIRRTDRLCAELWKAVQSEPEYAGNTTMFILPDFGRDADEDAGGNGFQHHRTGDAASRTTWMMALGAGVREGVVYDRPMQSIDLVPTPWSDDGILRFTIPRQTDEGIGLGSLIMLPRDLTAAAIRRLSSRSKKAGAGPPRRAAAAPAQFRAEPAAGSYRLRFQIPSRTRCDRQRTRHPQFSVCRRNSRNGFRSSRNFLYPRKLEQFDWVNQPGTVCRTGIGISLDHAPTGCISEGCN